MPQQMFWNEECLKYTVPHFYEAVMQLQCDSNSWGNVVTKPTIFRFTGMYQLL